LATIVNPAVTTGNAHQYALGKYYDKVLIARLLPDLRWDQVTEKKRLPQHMGTTVKFTGYKKLTTGTRLTEGTNPTPKALSTYNVTATLHQWGDYSGITDIAEVTAITSVITEAVAIFGEQSALTIDTEIRNVAFGGGFPSAISRISAGHRGNAITKGSVSALSAMNDKVYGFTVKLTGALSSGPTKNLSGMAALTASAWDSYDATLADIRNAVATLRSRNVKPWEDGYYKGLATPQALKGVMKDTSTGGWQDWTKYTSRDGMMRGEIGNAEGVRWIATTNAMERGANTGSNVSATFLTIVGRGALGSVDFQNNYDGTGKNHVIVKKANQYDISNPLNLIAGTVGWKVTFATCVLNTSCGIHLMALRV
jgi:N4-gp56 family major capsid protein